MLKIPTLAVRNAAVSTAPSSARSNQSGRSSSRSRLQKKPPQVPAPRKQRESSMSSDICVVTRERSGSGNRQQQQANSGARARQGSSLKRTLQPVQKAFGTTLPRNNAQLSQTVPLTRQATRRAASSTRSTSAKAKRQGRKQSCQSEDECAAFNADLVAIDEFLAKKRELMAKDDSKRAASAATAKKLEERAQAYMSIAAVAGTPRNPSEPTQFESSFINGMKKRKVLLYQVSEEMSEVERALHYSDIVYNHVSAQASRVLERCSQTCDKVNELQQRQVLGSTNQIENMMGKMNAM